MVSILNQNEDIFELVLDEKVILTHDTNRYRFKLPNENDVLGLPVGKHLSLIGLDNEGEQVSRSYTPVSTDNNKGCLLYTSPSPRDVEESRMPSSA